MNPSIEKEIIDNIKTANSLNLTPCLVFDRVSTKEQASTGFSLVRQADEAPRYTEYRKLHICYAFTISESAYVSTERKTFKLMVELSKRYKIKNLVFKCTDRMTRNWKDFVIVEELIAIHGYSIHLYEQNKILSKDMHPTERFMLAIEIAAAKKLSDDIKDHALKTYRWKAANGIAPGPAYPGYVYDKTAKAWLIDKATENMINHIFDEYDLKKTSIRDLADKLTAEGYKTRRGNRWNKTSLHRLLSSPLYAGKYSYEGTVYDGKHETYIPWERYTARLQRLGIKYHGKKKRTFEFAFRGLLRYNGRVMTGMFKKQKYTYYTVPQLGIYVRNEKILSMLNEHIEKIKYSEDIADYIKYLFRDSVAGKTKTQAPELSTITQKLGQLNIKQNKLLDLFLDEGLDQEALKRKLTDIQAQISYLENQKKTLRMDKTRFIIHTAEVIDRVRKFPDLYFTYSTESKGEILREMADVIHISDDDIRIEWKKPFSFILNEDILKIKDALEVLKCPAMGIQQDSFRTIVKSFSDEWQIWAA